MEQDILRILRNDIPHLLFRLFAKINRGRVFEREILHEYISFGPKVSVRGSKRSRSGC